ncbi:hypothetical protein J5J10_14915 [Ciceribacter sp. L1K23]|uniref:hypothetical protein n=1 Tax=unclassified Ciceribacter TaxID=2628820 RepID=UPI001ABEDC7F|nr:MULTISPECIES: hypothetical protein [unclassified Ciceribacter]MBO3758341.1 hypothetical protein [Ciceribacter sp. L1K22]MBR0556977.1 hypothetical protein [Ciceribacter sp. L1K23]
MEIISSDYRIKTVLGRLERIIDDENQRIGRDAEFDLKVSNAHKSRCLYELTMLFRDTDTKELAAGYIEQMHELKKKLALNARRVEAHLSAVRAVADLLKNAMQQADADGTYSQEQFLYCES